MESTSSVWPPKEPINIIVRMPNWLGDLVMATPILADLRKRYPKAKITAMCQSNVGKLLEHDPNIDELYIYKRPSGWIHRQHPLDIISNLQKGQYDLGILLTNSFSSAWWLYRGQVQNRIGFTGNLRSLLLNKALKYSPDKETQHQVVTYKTLLQPMGIPISDTEPALYVSDLERAAAKELLAKHQIHPEKMVLIGINPGAAYGSAKCWLPERFISVTQKLLENPNVAIIYFGDPSGAPLVHDICANVPSSRLLDLAGKTSLRELVALVEACSIFLTNDSGPMHIASALGTRLLALFGSTSDVRTGPYKGGKVLHKHVECSPCFKRECPIDFRCMTRISVDEVYAELEELLAAQEALQR